MAREIPYYEKIQTSAPGTLTNGEGDASEGGEAVYDVPPDVNNDDDDRQGNGGMRGGTTSEAVYDVPPDVDNVDDDHYYSVVGPTD